MQGGVVLAAHLLSLRDGMNKARAAVGLASPSYTDNLLTPTIIRAVHLTELGQLTQ